MSPTTPTWRVLRSQQDMARKNARQALLVIQQRRAQAHSEELLPPLVHAGQRSRATHATHHSSGTVTGDQ